MKLSLTANWVPALLNSRSTVSMAAPPEGWLVIAVKLLPAVAVSW